MDSNNEFSGAVIIALADGKVVYWNQAAASEFGWPLIEARGAAERSLADAPKLIDSGGAPGPVAGPQRVRIVLQSGNETWLESRMTRMLDSEGGVCGHLHRLEQPKASASAPSNPGESLAAKPRVTEPQVLHRLNNIFASIHSSLDLALGAKGTVEDAAFVHQAQESVRKGAQIIHELQLKQTETPVSAAANPPVAKPDTAFLAATGDYAAPAGLEGKERLLLAEDSKSMRALIRAVLTYRGYTVVEAEDGEAAVNKFQTDGPFDLVLVDLGLPKLEGAEVLRRLRAGHQKVRAIALSGSLLGSEEQNNGTDESFEGFLQKPFRNIELVKLVRRVLDQPAVSRTASLRRPNSGGI